MEKLIESALYKPLISVIKMMEEAKVAYRIAARDGDYFTMTRDYNPDRLNFYVECGKVTTISRG